MTSRVAVASHFLDVRNGLGRAFFAATSSSSGRLRHALSNVVTELGQSHEGRVAVRFGSDRDAAGPVQNVA